MEWSYRGTFVDHCMRHPSIQAILAIFCLGLVPLHAADREAPVRVQGVSAVSRVFKAAVPVFHEMGIEIKVGEECGNTQAITALGNGEIDIALLGRTLTAEDQANYPDKTFELTKIATQTLVIMIPRTVWESGVHALKREQVIELYEGRIDSWKQFGGEERSARFFEPAHGQGVWEIFVTWLYGDVRKAPSVRWDVVPNGAEAQNAVEFHSGGAAVAAVRWADRREVFPLAIIDDSGTAVEATAANVAAGKYPISRPAYVAVGNRPAGNRRKVIEYLLSEKGQALVAGSDLLPVAPAPKP